LEKHLARIKDEVGRIVLSLPSDLEVFPAKEEIKDPDSDVFTLDGEIQAASPPRPSAEPPSLSAHIFWFEFEVLMKTKAKRKSRSPIPSAA
jgi:hypothetical protein